MRHGISKLGYVVERGREGASMVDNRLTIEIVRIPEGLPKAQKPMGSLTYYLDKGNWARPELTISTTDLSAVNAIGHAIGRATGANFKNGNEAGDCQPASLIERMDNGHFRRLVVTGDRRAEVSEFDLPEGTKPFEACGYTAHAATTEDAQTLILKAFNDDAQDYAAANKGDEAAKLYGELGEWVKGGRKVKELPASARPVIEDVKVLIAPKYESKKSK